MTRPTPLLALAVFALVGAAGLARDDAPAIVEVTVEASSHDAASAEEATDASAPPPVGPAASADVAPAEPRTQAEGPRPAPYRRTRQTTPETPASRSLT